ncbi:hypothetical protein C0J52_04979 [Blattella germanica]|nr:hypothetical protein C0J52_04979 [Blattella germanica]
MAEYCEFDWNKRVDTKIVSPTKTISLNGLQDKSPIIKAVRDLIPTRPEIEFLRTDDNFILRFLHARKCNIPDSFELMANYYSYRQRNSQLFVIYRSLLLSLERLIEKPRNQVNGFVVVVDWSEFSFRQSSSLNPRILKLMIEGLQDCFPARFKGIHFINQPWYVEAALTIFLHGNNLSTLHDSVAKDILPAELGGEAPSYNPLLWANEMLEIPYVNGKTNGSAFSDICCPSPEKKSGVSPVNNNSISDNIPLNETARSIVSSNEVFHLRYIRELQRSKSSALYIFRRITGPRPVSRLY